ncbi:MAG: hypothetical protein ACTHK1_09755 [Actinomycetales bacterium]
MARRVTRLPTDVGRAQAPVEEAALDEALARIGELSFRLWAVRDRHSPARTWLGRVRCRSCGQLYPCETVEVTRLPLGA